MLDFDRIENLYCINEDCKNKLIILNMPTIVIWCNNCMKVSINFKDGIIHYNIRTNLFHIIGDKIESSTIINLYSSNNIKLNYFHDIDIYDQETWVALGFKYLKLKSFT